MCFKRPRQHSVPAALSAYLWFAGTAPLPLMTNQPSLIEPMKQGQGAEPAQAGSSSSSQSNLQATYTVDCLVLGAGVSGLAAAGKLAAAGMAVLVLEARNRLGGRVHSVPVTPAAAAAAAAAATDGRQPELCIDLGASWIHGICDNPMAALAAQHDITVVPTDMVETTMYSSTGEPLPAATTEQHEQIYQQFCSYMQTLQQDQQVQATSLSLSVAAAQQQFALDHQLAPEQLAALKFMVNRWIEQEYGADAAALSALYYDADEPCDGDDVIFPGGYGQIIAALAGKLQPGSILLQHEVVKVQYSRCGGVTVTASTPQGLMVQFKAKYAVVTFPLGVLKKHMPCNNNSNNNNSSASNATTYCHQTTGTATTSSKGGAMFDPPLPESKAAAVAHLGVGLLNKVVLLYDAAFWSPTPWLNRMPGPPYEGRWMEMFNLSPFLPGLAALVAFNAGVWAAEQESDDQLTQQVTDVLAAMYPHAAAAARSPRQVFVTRWGSDPWALGSYAYMAVGSSIADLETLAAPVNDVLFFAGEAMSLRNQGTVHGAHGTGVAAADAVLMRVAAERAAAAAAAAGARGARGRGGVEGLEKSM